MAILLPPEQVPIRYGPEVGTKIGPDWANGKVKTEQLLTGHTNAHAVEILPLCQLAEVLEAILRIEGSNSVLVAAAKVGADLKGKALYESPDAYVCRLSDRQTSEASKRDLKGRKTGPPSLTIPSDLDMILDLMQFMLTIKTKDGSIFWQCQLPPGHDYQLVVATNSSSCRVKLLTATMGGAGAQ